LLVAERGQIAVEHGYRSTFTSAIYSPRAFFSSLCFCPLDHAIERDFNLDSLGWISPCTEYFLRAFDPKGKKAPGEIY
jgi:hypothetical protein